MEKAVTQETFEKGRAYAQTVVDALNESVSPFHAVLHAKKSLIAHGFTEIQEHKAWELKPGNSYFFSRNGTTIVAFTVGKGCKAGGPEMFKIVGCHTDSPTIRLAPVSRVSSKGFEQMAIQTYGGGHWLTWFDRDLSLAGRVVVNNKGRLESRLWHHKEPLLRIPHLAIHLSIGDERTTFKPNKENHLRPVIATSVIDQLFNKPGPEEEKKECPYDIDRKHMKSFLELIAKETNCNPEDIIDFELSMFDASPSCLIGLYKEFISSGRLDNLCSSITALHALIERSKEESEEQSIDMIVLYDHEEIGSQTHQGADSTMLSDTIRRIFFVLEEGAGKTYGNLSCDRF